MGCRDAPSTSEEHDISDWFTKEDLDELFFNATTLDPVEGNTDPDAVPDAPEDPITKPGDLWILGNHRLLCGDSTSIDHLQKLVAGEQADLWITDPPYNVDYEGGTKEALKIQNDSMSDADFRQFLRDCYQQPMQILLLAQALHLARRR